MQFTNAKILNISNLKAKSEVFSKYKYKLQNVYVCQRLREIKIPGKPINSKCV